MKWVFERYLNPHFANIWLGVTAENQRRYNERWAIACQIPASVLFVSGEPLLGEIDLWHKDAPAQLPGWLITGCEKIGNRPGRPAKTEWFRSLRDQCMAAGVPFMLKQMEANGRVRELP